MFKLYFATMPTKMPTKYLHLEQIYGDIFKNIIIGLNIF